MSYKSHIVGVFVGGMVAACTATAPPPEPKHNLGFPKRIELASPPTHGIFDPSIAVAQDPGARLWMSFSGATSHILWSSLAYPKSISVHLAYSEDRGETWLKSPVTVSRATEVLLPPPNHTVPTIWNNETSSIVYDPAAIPAERWKVMWHRILILNGDLKLEHSWIAYKAAATPEGLQHAAEQKLFSGYAFTPLAGTAFQEPGVGAGTQNRPWIALDAIHPELTNCIFVEPSVLAKPGALYVGLDCIKVPTLQRRIAILKCSAPCNILDGASWQYLGSALGPADVPSGSGILGYSAPHLATVAGSDYLIVSPVTNAPIPSSYNGCRVHRFTSLDQAVLERDNVGKVVVTAEINLDPGSFNGACAYHEAASQSGVVIGQFYPPPEQEIFRLFLTGIGLR